MKLNVTLSPTPTVTSGFIMAVIFTRAVPFDQEPKFDINSLQAENIVYSSATAAPIASSTPLTTPTLPAANYYGLVIGKSVSGSVTDFSRTAFTPFTAELLNTALTSDASACGSNAAYSLSFP